MLRTARNYGFRSVSSKDAKVFNLPTRTVQSDADSTDLNKIVARYMRTGELPQTPVPPRFGDFRNVGDFRSCNDVIVRARESFEALPSRIRERFVTPEAFCTFCENPENLDEMRKLNLAVPKKEPVPEKVVKVEVVGGGEAPKSK